MSQCIYCLTSLITNNNSNYPTFFAYTPCNHQICSNCVVNFVFHNALDKFITDNNIINITCIQCKESCIELKHSQIEDILNQMNTLSTNVYNLSCEDHLLPSNAFCNECKRFTCVQCDKDHKSLKHKLTTNMKLYSYSNESQSFRSVSTEIDSHLKLPFKYQSFGQFKEHIETALNNFNKKYEDNLQTITRAIDKMINKLTEYKNKLITEKATRMQRETYIMSIFKHLYKKYYSDVYQAFSTRNIPILENLCSSVQRQFNAIEVSGFGHILEDLDSLSEDITSYLSGIKSLKFKYTFPIIPHTFTNTHTLIGHNDIVNCVSLLSNGDIASGGRDSVIRIWSKQSNYENIHTLEGHTNWISTLLILNNGYLLSGSYDGNIKIWDPYHNYENIETLMGHKEWVSSAIQLTNGYIVTSSADNSIIVRSNNRGYKPIEIVKEHTFGIFALCALNENWFASAGGDRSVKIWSLELTVERNLKGHNSQVNCLAALKEKNFIASGSNDKSIKIWDYYSGECINTIKAHNDGVSSLIVLNDGRLVSCSTDNLIKIWDNENNFNCTHILKGHSNVVNRLLVVDVDMILSASADKIIKMWTEQRRFIVKF